MNEARAIQEKRLCLRWDASIERLGCTRVGSAMDGLRDEVMRPKMTRGEGA